jgi:hypothetical protein
MTTPAGLSDEKINRIAWDVGRFGELQEGRMSILDSGAIRLEWVGHVVIVPDFRTLVERAGADAARVVSQREAWQRGYDAAAASVPREPVAWYTPLMGNYAHVVWGKRPDTPMEWAPLYAAPVVAQDSDKLGIAIRALKLIEHATKLEPDDGSYHEAAYSIAHRALSDLKWGTVNGAFPAVAQEAAQDQSGEVVSGGDESPRADRPNNATTSPDPEHDLLRRFAGKCLQPWPECLYDLEGDMQERLHGAGLTVKMAATEPGDDHDIGDEVYYLSDFGKSCIDAARGSEG